MDLKNIFGDVLFSAAPVSTIKELVEDAVAAKISLWGAYLRGTDLQGANLRGANLWDADLRGTDLRGAYLRDADLEGADLRGTDLQGANLRGADLRGTDLQGANLRGADLRGTDLRGANLRGANLWDADLRGAFFSPTQILTAYWGYLSDSLTADMMELDASAHPDRKAFDDWAKRGACPYSGLCITRIANFQEKRELWGKGKTDSIYNLMMRIFQEKSVKY